MGIYKVIGVMSGTSLDGVDLAYCIFDKKQGKWEYDIVKSITVEYDNKLKARLANATELSAEELVKLDFDYGHYLGKLCNAFIKRQHLNPDLVSSHGHTVFHNPDQSYTLQIGNGAAMASHLPCKLVFDFRSQDVALGGQGAPLVPIGDRLLFNKFDACVNLGGFANISMECDNKRIAWDICACNMALNFLSQKLGFEYDENGCIAKTGELNDALVNKLNMLPYFSKKHPKSLGKENFEKDMLPLINNSKLKAENLLRSCVEHIATQVSNALKDVKGKVLFTGGGALNKFLIKEIEKKIEAEVYVPDQIHIQFKEALIFAFMGALRVENEINVLSSVTGACKNHSSGVIV